MTTRLTAAARNAACDAINDLIDAGAGAGTLEVRSGTQPASADDAATGTALATFTLADPAFGAASSGTATAASISNVNGAANGTATWFRVKDSNGNTVRDGACGATGSGAEMELSTTTIAVGEAVSIASWTATMPAE